MTTVLPVAAPASPGPSSRPTAGHRGDAFAATLAVADREHRPADRPSPRAGSTAAGTGRPVTTGGAPTSTDAPPSGDAAPSGPVPDGRGGHDAAPASDTAPGGAAGAGDAGAGAAPGAEELPTGAPGGGAPAALAPEGEVDADTGAAVPGPAEDGTAVRPVTPSVEEGEHPDPTAERAGRGTAAGLPAGSAEAGVARSSGPLLAGVAGAAAHGPSTGAVRGFAGDAAAPVPAAPGASDPASAVASEDGVPAGPITETGLRTPGTSGTGGTRPPGGGPAPVTVGLPAGAGASPTTAAAEPGAGPGAAPDPALVERVDAERPAGDLLPPVRTADTAPVRADATAKAAAPPAPANPVAPPLTSQLAPALARLRTAPDGNHVLNIRVDPDDLGPVRVTAHIGAEGVRIELLGMTDTTRDALRGALSELRRELAATGLHADLDLASDDGSAAQGRPEQPRPTASRQPAAPTPAADRPRPVPHGAHGLDLLA